METLLNKSLFFVWHFERECVCVRERGEKKYECYKDEDVADERKMTIERKEDEHANGCASSFSLSLSLSLSLTLSLSLSS